MSNLPIMPSSRKHWIMLIGLCRRQKKTCLKHMVSWLLTKQPMKILLVLTIQLNQNMTGQRLMLNTHTLLQKRPILCTLLLKPEQPLHRATLKKLLLMRHSHMTAPSRSISILTMRMIIISSSGHLLLEMVKQLMFLTSIMSIS